MNGEASVLLLEFNELSPRLMTRFLDEGQLPNFARLYRESLVYTTDAQESGRYLQPWIQWVTVHTGVAAAEHGICELGEAQKLRQPTLTEIVSDAGLRVWNCGSMNARHTGRLNGCLLPDPWTTDVTPYPVDLLPYHQFIRRSVQEHTAEGQGLTVADYLSFGCFMATHGLSVSTSRAILSQLFRERGGKFKWQRVAVLDRLQWDLFRFYHQRVRPHFSSFFLNSTAHLQHKYWRNLEPELFAIKPTAEEQGELTGAVRFGYEQMDELVGRSLRLADTDTTLIFCTGLSQQPCLIYDEAGGKTFYRARDMNGLLAFAGVTFSFQYFPVMSEEFHLRFATDDEASTAARRLKDLRVSGESALDLRQEGRQLFGGCHIFRQLPQDAKLEDDTSGRSVPFFDKFYQASSLKSGMHHPDGMLWIRLPDRRHAVAAEKASLVAVAPTVLHLLGLGPPPWMKGEPLVEPGIRTSTPRRVQVSSATMPASQD